MFELIKKFHKDESGDIVQTGIIIALLAVIAVGAITFLGPKIKDLFDKTGDEIDNATNYSY
ncbi:MAG: hypothetical protein JG764_1711 [Clostridiales bacterium]|nr:hypothetical protein [Clostridiales bacterium]